jgi:serine/threonine protein kinase
VWRARHVHSRVKVAIKEIKLEKLNRKLRESLESEISVLQRSKHDNIIKLHEIIKVRDFRGSTPGDDADVSRIPNPPPSHSPAVLRCEL